MGWGNRSQKQMDPNDPAALLDQLMGSTRNMTETEKATARPAWEEKDVCQMYLAGCCPNALFHASQKRSDLAPCPKVHDCLLYTSPSPRDATLSRMPSSA